MPERFLNDLTHEEQENFINLLARRVARLTIVLSIVAAIVISCAITIPTTLIITNQFNNTVTNDISNNCHAIKQLRDIDSAIILRSVARHSNDSQAQDFAKYAEGLLQGLTCSQN